MANMEKDLNISGIVKKVLAESLDLELSKIKPTSLLIEDLGIDSFGFAELSFAVQEKFDFEIPVEEARDIKTVKDLTEYIDSKIKKV
jgi:acyl carrier protein